MTDKEIAIELGKKIIALEQEITGLSAILMNTKQPDGNPIPWQWMMEQDRPKLRHVYEQKLGALREAVDTSPDCTALLRSLHRYILSGPGNG